jgi:lipoate-protein ligase A
MAYPKDTLSTRISLLEQDMNRANTSLEKMSVSMEKHREESSNNIGKIHGRMEEFREELKEDIDKLKTQLEAKIESQNEILIKINDKLSDLDKWRWIVVGGAGILGYIISKMISIFGIDFTK